MLFPQYTSLNRSQGASQSVGPCCELPWGDHDFVSAPGTPRCRSGFPGCDLGLAVIFCGQCFPPRGSPVLLPPPCPSVLRKGDVASPCSPPACAQWSRGPLGWLSSDPPSHPPAWACRPSRQGHSRARQHPRCPQCQPLGTGTFPRVSQPCPGSTCPFLGPGTLPTPSTLL